MDIGPLPLLVAQEQVEGHRGSQGWASAQEPEAWPCSRGRGLGLVSPPRPQLPLVVEHWAGWALLTPRTWQCLARPGSPAETSPPPDTHRALGAMQHPPGLGSPAACCPESPSKPQFQLPPKARLVPRREGGAGICPPLPPPAPMAQTSPSPLRRQLALPIQTGGQNVRGVGPVGHGHGHANSGHTSGWDWPAALPASQHHCLPSPSLWVPLPPVSTH